MMHFNNRININLRLLYFAVFCLFCLTWIASGSDAISCDSCGRECSSACGTKHFRTCCFNYLRKRSVPLPVTNSRYDSTNQKIPIIIQSDFSRSNLIPILQEVLEDLLQNIKDLNHLIEISGKLNTLKTSNKNLMTSTEENQVDYP